jgi:hypothetical protein
MAARPAVLPAISAVEVFFEKACPALDAGVGAGWRQENASNQEI